MDGYEYGNTRLRAMKSRLLKSDQLAGLAAAGSIDGWIVALSRTSYQRAVEAAVSVGTGMACVPEILRQDMVDTLGKIPGYYSGRPGNLVRLLFLRYDVQNIKTILRRLSQGGPTEEILPSLLLVGTVSESILGELSRSGQLRSAIDRIATMRLSYSQPLQELRLRQPGAGVQQMDLALEKWYFEQAFEILQENDSLGESVAGSVRMEADLTNLLVSLRLVHYPDERLRLGGDGEGLMVRPGGLQVDLLRKCSQQQDMDTCINLLADTPYGAPLREGLRKYRQDHQLSQFERELKRYCLRWRAGLIAKDPLGIGVPVGYLALKENEIYNLRQTALWIHLGYEPEEIMANLEFTV